MKAIYVNRLDGKFCVCPFIGYRVANLEEFKQVIKKYFDKETGYPGLYFSTKHNHLKIVFSGHQYEHGEGGRWSIFNSKTNTHSEWQHLTQDLFDMFKDGAKEDAEIEALGALIKAQGGISVRIA